MTRYRDLGLTIGLLPPGPRNAITDVDGVRVGVATLIEGDGALQVGHGPIRTGVTVIVPHEDIGNEPVFAGCHTLNGNGELTGLEWVREAGKVTTPIGLTNTHSVGVVRDAIVASDRQGRANEDGATWSLALAGETWDGLLNDIDGFHVRAEHVHAALADATNEGPVPEGNVGGGTGMICHEFKGGTGTASRRAPTQAGGWTVGVLVQANYGNRERLAIDGVPVGREITTTEVPSPYDAKPHQAGSGSIIVIVATDAPLLPLQLDRIAQRAGLGIARTGGSGAPSSGDIFLAFSTANRGALAAYSADEGRDPLQISILPDDALGELFWATIEATEEAIANALMAAETMAGINDVTAHALPRDRLVEVMTRYGRGPSGR
jgi:D-aminopeptidase